MTHYEPHTTGDSEVTLQAIADRCGVALSTVSLALRGRPNVKPQTAQQIMAVAREMGYDPARHDMARRLALKKHGTTPINRTIAVIFPLEFLTGSYFTNIYHGILDQAQGEKFDVLTVYPPQHGWGPDQFALSPFFRRGEIDGVIMFGPWSAALHAILREMPGFAARPICMLFDEYTDCVAVRADDEHGIYVSTCHLLALGHRHLCLFVFPERVDPLPQRRITGATRALAEYGLDAATYLHLYDTPLLWLNPVFVPHNLHERNALSEQMIGIRTDFQQYLREQAQITAVIGLNDATALNIWYACTEAGWSVPDEISIIGVDDTDSMMGPVGEKLLTTVHVPLFEIGQQAAQQLIQLINNPKQTPEHRVLPTHLITRASTAPAQLTARQ